MISQDCAESKVLCVHAFFLCHLVQLEQAEFLLSKQLPISNTKKQWNKNKKKDLDSNLNKVPTAPPPLISYVSVLATCCIMPWARKRLEQLQIAFCLLKVPPFRVPFGRCRMAKHWSSTTLEFAKQRLLGPIAKVSHHQLCWESVNKDLTRW